MRSEQAPEQPGLAREPDPTRTVGRNLLSLVVARMVTAACGLVSLPIVYDRLGPHDFGIWAVLSGIVALVAVADLGLSSLTIRQVAVSSASSTGSDSLARTNAVLGLALVWGIGLALVGAAVVVTSWSWIADVLRFDAAADAGRWAALALLAGLLCDGATQPWRAVLEGTQRYQVLAVITGSTAVGSAVLTIGVALAGGGLVALAGVVAGVAAVRGACTVRAARRVAAGFAPGTRGVTRADVRAATAYGLPVQITTATGAVNLDLDRLILAGSSGPVVAGGFELGARVVNLLRLLPVYALVVLFPMAVTQAAEQGTPWLDRFNLVVTRVLTITAAVGTAALVAGAGPLVELWLGEPNPDATRCIQVLAPAYALNMAAGATGIISRVEGHPRRETHYSLLTAVLNLALTWPLLELCGPVGVPLATAIAVCCGTLYFLVSYHRFTDRAVAPILRAVWPAVVAGTAAAVLGTVAAGLLPDDHGRLGAAIAAGVATLVAVAVAGVVLVAAGALPREDLDGLRTWFRQGASAPAAEGIEP